LISTEATFRFAGGDAGESAWRAMKAKRATRASKPRPYANHAARLSMAPTRSPARAITENSGWRDGLKSLYCRSLSIALSDAIFVRRRAGWLGLTRLPAASSPVYSFDVLPPSWLLARSSVPASNVERLRASTVRRLELIDRSSEGKAVSCIKGQSLILDKAA